MTPEKTRAIVIRTIPFGETSSVVTLYCREFGKLRALAKGAWRPKSGFDAALDLLSTCQVLVLRKSSGGLDLLTEACLENRFRVGGSFQAFLGGMHVAELLDALTADADPQPELFDRAHATLRELSGLDDAADRIPALLVAADLALLRIVGHAPALLACAECRKPLSATARTPFGMLDGGSLCDRCRAGKRSVISVSRDAMATLRLLAGSPQAWREVVLPAPVEGEVRAIMTTYLAHILGRPLKVARWLQRPAARRQARSE
jgi:DNA repair protein RecO (recombination protein O)